MMSFVFLAKTKVLRRANAAYMRGAQKAKGAGRSCMLRAGLVCGRRGTQGLEDDGEDGNDDEKRTK